MTWLYSWIAGRWLALTIAAAVLLAIGGVYGLGRSHANLRWQARVAEAQIESARAAAQREAQWAGRIGTAEKRLEENAKVIADRDVALRAMANRLRDYASSDRHLPAATGPAGCARDIAAERQRAGEIAGLLAQCAEVGREIALERDQLAGQVAGLQAAWPR